MVDFIPPQIDEGDFQVSINHAIAEGRHVDYLKEVLKKYEYYKATFANIFTDKNAPNDIYEFRSTYLSPKTIWRDIEIEGGQTFLDLAEEIIASMGWMNDHMHGFALPKKQRESDICMTGSSNSFFAPGWEDDPHPTYKTDAIHICDIDYDKVPLLDFTFDFGDGHQFKIECKGRRKKNEQDRNAHFPMLIDQRGVGPLQYPHYE